MNIGRHLFLRYAMRGSDNTAQQGHRLTAPRRGLNIVRMSDGTVRKVMVK